MSDTPRTDKEFRKSGYADVIHGGVVDVNFCRQLERELEESKKSDKAHANLYDKVVWEREALRKERDQLRAEVEKLNKQLVIQADAWRKGMTDAAALIHPDPLKYRTPYEPWVGLHDANLAQSLEERILAARDAKGEKK